MVNASITARCNRECSYCFAMETLHDQDGDMSPEVFSGYLDLVMRSGMHEARILGGEPTLHARFLEYLDMALERGLRVLIFSGGIIPSKVVARLAGLSPEEISILLNVVPPGGPPRQIQRQEALYQALGDRVVLGLNIATPGVNLNFLLDLIERYGLAPSVRLGLAHPILDGGNDFLHPRHYPEVGKRVAGFAVRARERGVEIHFDCGWVPCMFPEGSLKELGFGPDQVGLRCNPILDVLPDGKVISCFPLAQHASFPIQPDKNGAWLRNQFSEEQRSDRSVMLYKECADCDWRAKGACSGGCLAGSLRRVRSTHGGGKKEEAEQTSASVNKVFTVSHPAASACCDSKRTLEHKPGFSIPYIDQPPAFWCDLARDFGAHVEEVYFPLPIGVIGTGRPPQPDRYLESFLREAPLPKGALANAVTLPGPVAEIGPRVVAELKRLRDTYGVTKVTVADLSLARFIRESLPQHKLIASVLMEISEPIQVKALEAVCDILVPAGRVVRDLPALRAIRDSFKGRIRLLVNEACIPGCPHRTQHFHEMAYGVERPKSLCADLLASQPWMRLTGSWILPQFLHFYDGLYDELKLAGRVTLRDPNRYRRVLQTYLEGGPLKPNEIGGGPSSVLEPIDMPEDLFAYTLTCGRRCNVCTRCPDYYQEALVALHARSSPKETEPTFTRMIV